MAHSWTILWSCKGSDALQNIFAHPSKSHGRIILQGRESAFWLLLHRTTHGLKEFHYFLLHLCYWTCSICQNLGTWWSELQKIEEWIISPKIKIALLLLCLGNEHAKIGQILTRNGWELCIVVNLSVMLFRDISWVLIFQNPCTFTRSRAPVFHPTEV